MAKRKAGRLAKRTSRNRARSLKRPSAKARSAKNARKKRVRAKAKAAAKRPAVKRATRKPNRKAARKKSAVKARARTTAAKAPSPRPRRAPIAARSTSAAAPGHTSRVERERRILSDVVQTPPSSLDMERHGSAARTGRAEMAEHAAQRATMTPDIASGDVDVNTEDAYFTGDEAPGGDNQTPDQDRVDDIGRALGVEYNDAEELRSGDKVADRDKQRWELDPASSEDYRDRKR
jgi:hypothetical protein